MLDRERMFKSISRICAYFELRVHECCSLDRSKLQLEITNASGNVVDVIVVEPRGFNIHTLNAIWNQLYTKLAPELNDTGCMYCDGGRSLMVGRTNDRGVSILYPNKLIAYGYDINGIGSNGLITKINYCPMCGRKLSI